MVDAGWRLFHGKGPSVSSAPKTRTRSLARGRTRLTLVEPTRTTDNHLLPGNDDVRIGATRTRQLAFHGPKHWRSPTRRSRRAATPPRQTLSLRTALAGVSNQSVPTRPPRLAPCSHADPCLSPAWHSHGPHGKVKQRGQPLFLPQVTDQPHGDNAEQLTPPGDRLSCGKWTASEPSGKAARRKCPFQGLNETKYAFGAHYRAHAPLPPEVTSLS